jgi:hypothetical protein
MKNKQYGLWTKNKSGLGHQKSQFYTEIFT